MTEKTQPDDENSLDLLEQQDLVLRQCSSEIKNHRGPSMEDRYKYGGLVKSITRQIAVRQSCLMDVGFAIRDNSELRPIADRMLDHAIGRRVQIDRLGKMSRNVQGMYLNMGQDFDGQLTPLMDEINEEIDWELSEAIPLIRSSAASTSTPCSFRSAKYIRHHARMELSPNGRLWTEYMPFISRLLTVIDHLKDHPRASAHDEPASSS